ncbi:hypothetical protein H5410_064673 [Solanum commersonii]|uniref:Uncharacterized protein n=1 Tax=Solanum commersonii TaxID=4109 RepID=A0A9J5VYQ3_SOLCO|nr:hypothetical protein H5410_064673 [Solanum commersonii]
MWLQSNGFIDVLKDWWNSYTVMGTPDFMFTQKLKSRGLVEPERLREDCRTYNSHHDQKLKSTEPKIRIEADSNCRRSMLENKIKMPMVEGEMANSHKRGNTIDKLKIGESITDDKGLIKESILDYYQKLYKETESWTPSTALCCP